MATPGTTEATGLVTDTEAGGTRLPEDELADLEKAAGAKDQAETSEAKPEAEGAAGDPEDASVAKLQELMVKKGIKDIGSLVELVKDLESRNTRLGQDVQRLSAVTSFPMDVRKPDPPVGDELELPENLMDLVLDKSKLVAFAKKLEDRAYDRVRREQDAERSVSVRAQVDAKRAEDPEKFERLRPLMFKLSVENPKADLNTIWQMAERAGTDDEVAFEARVKKVLGVKDEADISKLKAILGRVKAAPISGGTGRQVEMVPDKNKEHEALLTAIANADKYDT